MTAPLVGLDTGFVSEIRAEQLRRKRAERNADMGKNLANSVADCRVPFPWMDELRRVSPITDRFSFLIPYWYRVAGRWVLYDAVPRCLIHDDENQGAPITGKELIGYLEGPAPRDLHEDDRSPYVSDVQHELYRLHRAYARPFWVLQGDGGGHQVNFSPWQQNVLIAKGLPPEPPKVGSLPACPFDMRTSAQLNHLNRLHQLDDRLDKLQASASVEWANAEMENIQREIREAEMKFIESQMQPIVDMSMSLVQGQNTRSEHDDQIIRVAPGMAARAKDAYDEYRETGNYTMRNITGQGL